MKHASQNTKRDPLLSRDALSESVKFIESNLMSKEGIDSH